MSKIGLKTEAHVYIGFSYADYNSFVCVHFPAVTEVNVSDSSPNDSRNLLEVRRYQDV